MDFGTWDTLGLSGQDAYVYHSPDNDKTGTSFLCPICNDTIPIITLTPTWAEVRCFNCGYVKES